jgi:zeta-carotene desaturase
LVCADPFFAATVALRPSPIISINLWFDLPITELEFAGLRGTTIQWLFDKSRILGANDHQVSLVLSGAHEHVSRSKEDLLALSLRELAGMLPAVGRAKLLHSLIVKERFATFSPCPETEALRPPARTPIRGLFLAGDWTATGLPATIEGAVQSGYTAAGEILHSS